MTSRMTKSACKAGQNMPVVLLALLGLWLGHNGTEVMAQNGNPPLVKGYNQEKEGMVILSEPELLADLPKDQKIFVVAITENRQKGIEKQDSNWSALFLLEETARNPRRIFNFILDEPTIFYAFFLDRERRLEGEKEVVFTWYSGMPGRQMGDPVAEPIYRVRGCPWPVAYTGLLLSYKPGISIIPQVFEPITRNPPVFGPKVVQVCLMKGREKETGDSTVPVCGELLAETHFKIHPSARRY